MQKHNSKSSGNDVVILPLEPWKGIIASVYVISKGIFYIAGRQIDPIELVINAIFCAIGMFMISRGPSQYEDTISPANSPDSKVCGANIGPT